MQIFVIEKFGTTGNFFKCGVVRCNAKRNCDLHRELLRNSKERLALI